MDLPGTTSLFDEQPPVPECPFLENVKEHLQAPQDWKICLPSPSTLHPRLRLSYIGPDPCHHILTEDVNIFNNLTGEDPSSYNVCIGFFKRNGQLEEHHYPFISAQAAAEYAERMVSRIHRAAEQREKTLLPILEPMVQSCTEANLPENISRLCFSIRTDLSESLDPSERKLHVVSNIPSSSPVVYDPTGRLVIIESPLKNFPAEAGAWLASLGTPKIEDPRWNDAIIPHLKKWGAHKIIETIHQFPPPYNGSTYCPQSPSLAVRLDSSKIIEVKFRNI